MADSDAPMQFEHAEMAAAVATCGSCKRAISTEYWTVGDQQLCGACKRAIELHLQRPVGWRTWARVFGLGSAAALAGTVLYFAVLKITGYQLGLIAIAVGLLVGGAVRKASGGRGGWKFQLVAMVLTYCSIVSSYMPTVYQELQQAAEKKAVVAKTETAATTTDSVAPLALAKVSAKTPTEPAAAEQANPYQRHPVLAVGVFLVLLFAISATAPILAGVQNFLGWIVIGFALYEAWKMNRRAAVVFAGPFTAAASPPAT